MWERGDTDHSIQAFSYELSSGNLTYTTVTTGNDNNVLYTQNLLRVVFSGILTTYKKR